MLGSDGDGGFWPTDDEQRRLDEIDKRLKMILPAGDVQLTASVTPTDETSTCQVRHYWLDSCDWLVKQAPARWDIADWTRLTMWTRKQLQKNASNLLWSKKFNPFCHQCKALATASEPISLWFSAYYLYIIYLFIRKSYSQHHCTFLSLLLQWCVLCI